MTLDLSWPTSLPAPSIEGYGLEDMPALRRTEMETGSARQRLSSTQARAEFPVKWEFTLWQYGIFESWLANRATYGATWFAAELLSGSGLVQCEARFKNGKAPAKARNGQRWVVTATLDVRDRPMLSDAELTLVIDEDPDALFAAVDALHVTIETEFPTA